jgi:hypothetical protein
MKIQALGMGKHAPIGVEKRFPWVKYAQGHVKVLE